MTQKDAFRNCETAIKQKWRGGTQQRLAIQGGRGSILKCGVSGVIVPVLNFEIELCSTPLHHWKYSAGHP
ncbi:MAG: hypothetical protein NUV75_13720 [Gallionella sp.]|nr:hypothetical protein [Gallionella sp.]